MKVCLRILTFLFLFSMPESSFAIVYMPQDSIQVNKIVKTTGDKIAQWGFKSSAFGAALFMLVILSAAFVGYEMYGLLSLLLLVSINLGLILGLLGLALCISALIRKDTTKKGRKQARTGLFVLLFGALLSTILILLFLG